MCGPSGLFVYAAVLLTMLAVAVELNAVALAPQSR